MMVPHTYLYSSSSSASTKTIRDQEKQRMEVSTEGQQKSKATGKKNKAQLVGMPPKIFTLPPLTPSKPVVIPTRTRDGGQRKSRDSVVKDRRQDLEVPHDRFSTPPSMAAFLAISDQPGPQGGDRLGPRRDISSFANRQLSNARLRDGPKRSISSSSPQSWDALLSPPEVSELETGSLESDATLGPISSVRSQSTESMPSLETDTESLFSASNPATPAFLHGNRDKRQKSVSSSMGEDCVLDHPLLPRTSQIHRNVSDEKPDAKPDAKPDDALPSALSPLARSTSYFKSNLTASFRRLRTAAQSLSAFTASPSQQEDHLARALLSLDSQFTDERWPRPSADPPDPALRRYLNPTTFSPAELHFHSEESPEAARSPCTASIQLQTYRRRSDHGSDKASSPPMFTSSQQKALDSADGLSTMPPSRQREARENSDFLRVIVLEMNMRKQGKLDDGSPGRAKLWLPARQIGSHKGVELARQSDVDRTKIPTRWVGVQP